MASKIIIQGGKPLSGEVTVSGMKNAALPILFATILIRGSCTLENIPPVNDISLSLEILRRMGATVEHLDRTTVRIDTTNVVQGASPKELVSIIRGSSYLLGAELGRFGKADSGWPGGCDFGVRPLNLHFKGFEALGGTVQNIGDRIHMEAPNGLSGSYVYFDLASVGATANVMLAAVLAEGTTVIENAAREPHIVDLANFLNTCGANITGAGTPIIKVRGVRELHGCHYAIIPDMIEAGTYMVAAAATGGSVKICSVIPKHVEIVMAKLMEMGIDVKEEDESITVTASGERKSISITTIPYPGFPTDMHPQFAPLLCIANGISTISEGVWENRFRYVEELRKMGANILVGGDMATFIGGQGLIGASVTATDLRAGAALIIAGLIANGKTEISGVNCIHRGYCDIVEKFQALGADISEVTIS
ncbi:MAG: UDP-N-acetylglucosamine 1-carboxyvinyltransferase [Clostridia bacterium]|nr:UDP-N-acetylglucosamine 1-carboxyvinyltransferase [Clostridia bacterium]